MERMPILAALEPGVAQAVGGPALTRLIEPDASRIYVPRMCASICTRNEVTLRGDRGGVAVHVCWHGWSEAHGSQLPRLDQGPLACPGDSLG